MKKYNFVIAAQAEGYQYLLIHQIAIPDHGTKDFYPEVLSMDNFKSRQPIDKIINIEYLIYDGKDFEMDRKGIFRCLEIVEHDSIWSFYKYVGWNSRNICFENELKVK